MGSNKKDETAPLGFVKSKMIGRLEKIREAQRLNTERTKLINSWISIMAQTNSYNNFYDTFEIVDEIETAYGWSFRLFASDGLTFNSLDNLKPIIEHDIGCTFLWKVDDSNKFAMCKVVYANKIRCNNIPFEPVKVKPYEICPGLDITGEPIILDVNASPHILIAGQTRKGKNGAADSIILSWMNSCTENEIELYLFQCAKIDLIKYRNCKQVKEFILLDVYEMLGILTELVETEIPRRLRLFESMFSSRKGENIADYNRIHPECKLSYIYIILDEFLELMIQPQSDKDRNEIKCDILANLQRIGQMGAAVGIQYMILHQKPEKALCPTFIKNMSSIRICFGFDDESCGRIVLGDRDGSRVLNLPARRAYINNNGALELMYTSNLDGRRDMFITPNEVERKQSRVSRHSIKVEEEQKKQIDKQVKFEAIDVDTPILQSTDVLLIDSKKIPRISLPESSANIIENNDKLLINMFKFDISNKSIDVTRISEINIEYMSREELGLKKSKESVKDTKTAQIECEANNRVVNKLADRSPEATDTKIETSMYSDTDIDEIQKEIDKIVEGNSKKVSGWVPYEPKEGDKKADIDTVKESKYFSRTNRKE